MPFSAAAKLLRLSIRFFVLIFPLFSLCDCHFNFWFVTSVHAISFVVCPLSCAYDVPSSFAVHTVHSSDVVAFFKPKIRFSSWKRFLMVFHCRESRERLIVFNFPNTVVVRLSAVQSERRRHRRHSCRLIWNIQFSLNENNGTKIAPVYLRSQGKQSGELMKYQSHRAAMKSR